MPDAPLASPGLDLSGLSAQAQAFQQQMLRQTTAEGWQFGGSLVPIALTPALASAVDREMRHFRTPVNPAPSSPATGSPAPVARSPAAKPKPVPDVNLSAFMDWLKQQAGLSAPPNTDFPLPDESAPPAEKPADDESLLSFEKILEKAEEALINFGTKQVQGILEKAVKEGLYDQLSEPLPFAAAGAQAGGGGTGGLLGKLEALGTTLEDLINNPGKILDMGWEQIQQGLEKLPGLALDGLVGAAVSQLGKLWPAVDDSSPLLAQLANKFAKPFVQGLVKQLLSGVTSLDQLIQNFDQIVADLSAKLDALLNPFAGEAPGAGMPAARLADKDNMGDFIVTGLPTVLVNKVAIARVTDLMLMSSLPIVTGSTTVISGAHMTARIGESTAAGSKILTGSPLVLIGGVPGAEPGADASTGMCGGPNGGTAAGASGASGAGPAPAAGVSTPNSGTCAATADGTRYPALPDLPGETPEFLKGLYDFVRAPFGGLLWNFKESENSILGGLVELGPAWTSLGCGGGGEYFWFPPDKFFWGLWDLTPACDNHDAVSYAWDDERVLDLSLGELWERQVDFFRDVVTESPAPVLQEGPLQVVGYGVSTVLAVPYFTAVTAAAFGQTAAQHVIQALSGDEDKENQASASGPP